jgi:hypothetical protein
VPRPSPRSGSPPLRGPCRVVGAANRSRTRTGLQCRLAQCARVVASPLGSLVSARGRAGPRSCRTAACQPPAPGSLPARRYPVVCPERLRPHRGGASARGFPSAPPRWSKRVSPCSVQGRDRLGGHVLAVHPASCSASPRAGFTLEVPQGLARGPESVRMAPFGAVDSRALLHRRVWVVSASVARSEAPSSFHGLLSPLRGPSPFPLATRAWEVSRPALLVLPIPLWSGLGHTFGSVRWRAASVCSGARPRGARPRARPLPTSVGFLTSKNAPRSASSVGHRPTAGVNTGARARPP